MALYCILIVHKWSAHQNIQTAVSCPFCSRVIVQTVTTSLFFRILSQKFNVI